MTTANLNFNTFGRFPLPQIFIVTDSTIGRHHKNTAHTHNHEPLMIIFVSFHFDQFIFYYFNVPTLNKFSPNKIEIINCIYFIVKTPLRTRVIKVVSPRVIKSTSEYNNGTVENVLRRSKVWRMIWMWNGSARRSKRIFRATGRYRKMKKRGKSFNCPEINGRMWKAFWSIKKYVQEPILCYMVSKHSTRTTEWSHQQYRRFRIWICLIGVL